MVGDVGTGKTRVALAYYEANESPKDLLVITTAKKRDDLDWEKEALEFDIGASRDTTLHGVIEVDSWQNIHKYEDRRDIFLIADEQRVVGSGAWTKSFLKIAKNNHWILLSATPGDTWMDYIPVFVANGFYKNKTQFMTMHAVYDRWAKYPKVNDWRHTDILEKLKRRIMIPMKRPKDRGPSRNPVYQIVVDHDKQALKTLRRERKDPWTGEPLKNVSQYCFAQRKLVNSDPSRIKETMDICIRHPKIVIFYNYDFELEELLSLRRRTGIPVYQYNGHHHDDIPQDGDWIYLVNYGSGAAGWNCTQTDTMLFYSLNYSYRIMEQAAGRIDRINSPFKELNYYILRSFAPIDSAILRALANKETFNERTFASKDISGKEG